MDHEGGGGEVWFENGLRFDCTGCGHCCTGSNGYVWVEEAEIRELAAHVGLALDDFGRRFLRRVGTRYALLESQRDGACVFLEGTACRVYDARPRQCRSYPFWPANLATPADWQLTAARCEGIRDDAPLWSRERIHAARSR
jgi:Fe-S-cluster containining protein